MLQVAIDTGPLHGRRTGIGNAVAWYLDALEPAAAAHRVSVQRYLTSARATLEPGERRLPIPAAVALRLWSRTPWPRVDRALGRPDVVHGTNYVVPPTRVPSLVSVYDCWFLEQPDRVHPDVALASRALLAALRRGATALCSSQATADRLRTHVDVDRTEVVHLGPPPPAPTESGRRDDRLVERVAARPMVVSIGTLERRKNVPTLVRAFGRLAAESPDAVLVIAGADGDDAAATTAAISALAPDARDRVIRAGSVSVTTKRWLLETARVLAYPSLDEGFGFPLLEAHQAGLPVAASTAGSIPEVGGAGALYSAPDDADALAANMFGLLTPGAVRDRVVDGGRRNLERFGWETTVSATVDLYHRLAERR